MRAPRIGPREDRTMTKKNLNNTPVSQIPTWFERKFEFTFPVEHWLILCVRLRGTPARLEEILRGVSPDVLIRKAADKWSAQEHAGHLLDLESLECFESSFRTPHCRGSGQHQEKQKSDFTQDHVQLPLEEFKQKSPAAVL